MVDQKALEKKDPNRRKVRNHQNRLIDYDGPQYKKLINFGYRLNKKGDQLIGGKKLKEMKI